VIPPDGGIDCVLWLRRQLAGLLGQRVDERLDVVGGEMPEWQESPIRIEKLVG
jgi:hypothetical protein